MQRACHTCGQAFTPHSKTIRHCPACRPANHARRTYDAVYQRNRTIVLKRDAGNPCPLCGGPGPLTEVDHIIPVARGGTHALSNMVAVHPSCNRAKGAKPIARPRPTSGAGRLAPARRPAAERRRRLV
jgi:5-methylcytosine-specific restriction endonuclease McrA